MAKMQSSAAFAANKPALDEEETRDALNGGQIVVGIHARPLLESPQEVGFLVVKFALADETFQTFLFDRIAAVAIAQAVENLEAID